MATRDECSTVFGHAVDRLLDDIKFDTSTPGLERISSRTRTSLKEIIEETTDAISSGKYDHLDDKAMKSILANRSKKILDTINNYRAQTQTSNALSGAMESVTTKEALLGKLTALFDVARRSTTRATRWFHSSIDNVIDTMYKRGDYKGLEHGKFKKAFHDEMAGGTKFRKLLEEDGITDPAEQARLMYEAARHGRDVSGRSKYLNMWGKLAKELEKRNTGEIQKTGQAFNARKGHVLPFKLHNRKLQAAGLEGYSKSVKSKDVNWEKMLGKKLDEIDDADIDEWIKATYDRNTRTKASTGNKLDITASREIEFNKVRDEYEYIAEFGDGDNVIQGFINHRMGMLQQAKLQQLFGNDLDAVDDVIKDAILTDKKLARLISDKDLDPEILALKNLTGMTRSSTSTIGETSRDFVGTLKALASAVLAQKSAIRNFAFDNTLIPALQKSLLSGDSFLLLAAKEYSGLMTDMIRVGNTGRMAQFVETQGLSMEFSMHYMQKGLSEASDSLAERGLAAKSKSKIRRGIDAAGEAVSKMTLNDLMYRASRVRAYTFSTKLMENMMDSTKNIDDLPNLMRLLLRESGIDQDTWNILRKAKRLQYDNGTKVRTVGVDIDELGKIKKRSGETSKQARARVRESYMDLLDNMITGQVASNTLYGRARFLSDKGAFDRLGSQFFGIALSQYRGVTRWHRAAAGLDPDAGDIAGLADLALKDPKALGKLAATMVGGGVMTQWLYDLADGKTPDMSPGVIAKGLSMSGAGGVYGMFANSFVYSGDAVSTPIGTAAHTVSAIAKAKSKDAKKRAAHKAVKLIPGMNTWITAGALKALFYKGLNTKPSRHARKQLEEKNQKDLIAGD